MNGKSSLWEFLTASWRDHAVVFAVSTWSGLITSLHRIMSRKTKFSVIALAIDTLFSGFAGVLVGWACHALDLSAAATLAAAGIAGHSAPRTLWLLERKLHQWLGVDSSDNDGHDETDPVDPGKPTD